MKISQLLREAEDPRDIDTKSGPEEPAEDDIIPGVEEFKKIAAPMGNDLYSFTNLRLGDSWNASTDNYLTNLVSGIELDDMPQHARALQNAWGREGNMTFVIVNARNGAVYSVGFGTDAESQGVDMPGLDRDQEPVRRRLLSLYKRYESAINSSDSDSGESARSDNVRSEILSAMNYFNQPVRMDPEEQEKLKAMMGGDIKLDPNRKRPWDDYPGGQRQWFKDMAAKRNAEEKARKKKK